MSDVRPSPSCYIVGGVLGWGVSVLVGAAALVIALAESEGWHYSDALLLVFFVSLEVGALVAFPLAALGVALLALVARFLPYGDHWVWGVVLGAVLAQPLAVRVEAASRIGDWIAEGGLTLAGMIGGLLCVLFACRLAGEDQIRSRNSSSTAR